MKTLSKRNAFLISQGMNTIGFSDPEAVYYYIEENLLVNQAEKIHKFLKWLFATNRPYSEYNANERWGEFIGGVEAPKEYFNVEYEFDYMICNQKQTAFASKRLKEPTLECVKEHFKGSNKDLNYKIRIVDQDRKTIREIQKEEILSVLK